jgi:hypothetical protein
VTEEPEQVLPEDGVAAAPRVEEARAEVLVEQQHDAPATSGPTEAMNMMLAMQIIHTTIGTSVTSCPARASSSRWS